MVKDTAPTTVVSAGMRGARTKSILTETAGRLRRWIEDNPSYQAAAPLRVMGYNSPFVPRANQYFEVQIPVQRVMAVRDAGL